jgi:hypothetical protein
MMRKLIWRIEVGAVTLIDSDISMCFFFDDIDISRLLFAL